MNEKGLVIADLVAGDHTKTAQHTGRTNITTTSAIRVLLDKAANVKEALTLLESFDMHSDIDYSHHLAISDATGRSVVVEWVDDKMLVAESPLCTNHYLAESRLKDYSIYSEDSHRRYDSMKQMRDSLSTMSSNDVVESIRRVASKDMTRWSVVFDSKTLTATYYQYGDFGKPYSTTVK
jgi:penicillin V acylase-like amidase (Ntn superfamily)